MVEVLHGAAVADPYRWLEDGDDPATLTWTTAQNGRTRAVLDAIPARSVLHERLLALLQVGAVGAPAVAGNRVFTLDREGDQDQAVLVVRSAEHPDEPPRLLIDPQRLAADHAAAVDWFSPSPDGRLVAYGISEAGTERGTLRVLDADANVVLDDAIPNVRHPSVAWLPDGSAFAYSRLPDPDSVPEGDDGYWETVWWHRIGDTDDELVLGDLDRTALPLAGLSPDGRWMVLQVHLLPTRTDVLLVDRGPGQRTVV
ncbi:MAG: prolyl oligopeptidase family serine peptidase, partial [Acidimicrobiales bacterium]